MCQTLFSNYREKLYNKTKHRKFLASLYITYILPLHSGSKIKIKHQVGSVIAVIISVLIGCLQRCETPTYRGSR